MMTLDSSLLFSLIGVFALLICSAFFSGSETALMALRRARLHEMAKKGIKGVSRVQHLVDAPERLLSTILLGNNLVNIAASALTTGLFIKLFGELGMVYATFVMTALVLIFAEVLPKTIASLNPEKVALRVSFMMTLIVWVLKPATKIVQGISYLSMRLLGIRPKQQNAFSENDLRGAIGLGLQYGVLENEEHRMLDSILDLEALTVEDVMIHRSSIESLDVNISFKELLGYITRTPHSRIPMWEEEPDNIIGVLHVKDFYHAAAMAQTKGEPFQVRDILQHPYFVPESTNIAQQLFEFRRLRRHLALVIDEYGDLQGLVTLEDILEEIVGEIEDEHDVVQQGIVKNEDGSFVLPGTFPVRDANRELALHLPEDEDAVTLGGLMVDTLGHIPAIGERVSLNKLTLKVLAKKRQGITQILVTPQLKTTQD